MRARSPFLAVLGRRAATACSFTVSTSGLTGGSDPGAGGASQQGSGAGASDPGVVLGDAESPVVATAPDSGAAAPPSSDDAGAPVNGTKNGPSDAGTPSGSVDAAPRDSAPPDTGPPSACSLGHARVFLTSTLYGAAFGGVSGADADCAARAAAQNLGGKWRAWMSDSTTSAANHVYASSGAYVLLDGTVVADDFTALTSGSLAHAIDQTELGAPISDGQTEVWTGIDVTGSMTSAGFCTDGNGNDWASNDPSAATPLVGHSNATDATWSAAYLQVCDRTNVRLYCFESCK